MAVWSTGLLPAAGLDDYAEPGRFKVEVQRFDWHDGKRDRDVPATVYLPQRRTNDGSAPVIIFSHGLGGTRDGYEYLGRHWASHGFVTVHLQHPGSDDGVWKGTARPMEAMRAATTNPQNITHRPRDVSFAIDELTRLEKADAAWRGRVDLSRLGVAGHSFGAYTTLAVAGQGGTLLSARDERVKAAIPISAPATKGARPSIYDAITIPLLHLTGTKDDSPIGHTSPSDRRIPFDRIQNAPEFLITFEGADHLVFGGRRTQSGDVPTLQMVKASTTAFWEMTLRDDAKARAWLNETNGFKAALGTLGTFEQKTPRRLTGLRPAGK